MADSASRDIGLTEREREILRTIGQGYNSREVGQLLFISKRTVDYHLANVYAKLNVTNRLHALIVAQRLGIFVPPDLHEEEKTVGGKNAGDKAILPGNTLHAS